MTRNILKSSLQNASFSIVFQILFRCITFFLNAFIIRTVGQDVLGIMNVRLLLLESTILFLSREPIMRACLTDTKSHNWPQIINQVWLSVPLTGVLSFFLVYVWINLLSPTEDAYLSQYRLGCYAIALSCIIEQMTQIVVLIAQSFCFVKLKIIFETVYIISRTVIFVVLVVRQPSNAINAFSSAQILSAIILSFLYYGFFSFYIPTLNVVKANPQSTVVSETVKKKLFSDMSDFNFSSVYDFFPLIMDNQNSVLDKKMCLLTVSFVKQSIIKQILTEGEKYVMTLSPVLTFSQQSMYNIVDNLGSLAARFIFRPIEDSAYFYFTQMIKREMPIEKQNEKNISESTQVLGQLCKVVSSVGLVVVTFGQAYSYTLLYLYGGHKLVEISLPVILLRFHCFAIVLLAINGVTEGYVFATMSNKQLDRYNYLMVVFSILFLLISYLLTNTIGPVGFILANCVNMSARITHSFIYIKKKYENTKHNPLKELIPRKKFLGILFLSGVITKSSELYILENSILLHIGIGAVMFLLTLLVWAMDNIGLVRSGYSTIQRKMSLKAE